MPFRRLLSLLSGNPQVIESLSETKVFRRAAQISVGFYQRMKASGPSIESLKKKEIKKDESGFLSSFKSELSKEYENMKKNDKLK